MAEDLDSGELGTNPAGGLEPCTSVFQVQLIDHWASLPPSLPFFCPQGEVQKAVSVLVKCVLNKFASDSKTPEGEVLSLAAATPSEHNGPDPIALYRRLLSQPLPYDYKCPSLMPGVLPQSLGREKLFLWLSYW